MMGRLVAQNAATMAAAMAPTRLHWLLYSAPDLRTGQSVSALLLHRFCSIAVTEVKVFCVPAGACLYNGLGSNGDGTGRFESVNSGWAWSLHHCEGAI